MRESALLRLRAALFRLPQALDEAAQRGYAGVECSLRLAHTLGGTAFAAELTRRSLAWIPIVFSSGPVWDGFDPFLPGAPRAAHTDGPAAHAAALRAQLDAALGACARRHCGPRAQLFPARPID